MNFLTELRISGTLKFIHPSEPSRLPIIVVLMFLFTSMGCRTLFFHDGESQPGYVLDPPAQYTHNITTSLDAVINQLLKPVRGQTSLGPEDIATMTMALTATVSKLYEHSERTLFLEFSLFRLNELARNRESMTDEQLKEMYQGAVSQAAYIEQAKAQSDLARAFQVIIENTEEGSPARQQAFDCFRECFGEQPSSQD